ncbi:glycosyltransferase involved in cell wall biosynthesis [Luteimonas cucumeris]|uniref:Glycosyltransferase involved in cell wall biosynthesis n=1 Tax=Luteimonas cucumeris TaxID=985012 RepID=A0A562LE75_9GAMM|nr:glycosyltransferase family 2 protein [Luteimonas cucumeris]TWI05951.1 glycosyltransferase involved in cell wall biosynthesis [Luteimonas cucumeris]
MPPEVSVIVPNYNHAPYLVQRIDSVLAQTCQDFELILLDDCSTDDSRTLLERYRSHPKVSHLVCNEQNSGSTFKQWDKGIALAQGRYIWIAESDDWCEPTFLETMLEGIRQDDDCVLSYCQAYFVGPEGRLNWQSHHDRLSELVEGGDFIRRYMAPISIYNASMVLWRKDRYPSIPRDFTRYRFCGDWMFWIALARLGKVHISGKLLDYYRQHPDNVSSGVYRSGLNFVEELEVLNWMFSEGLIGDREYTRVYKQKFREYWPLRGRIDPALRPRIEALFRRPSSPATPTLAIRLGAIWHDLRGRGRSR